MSGATPPEGLRTLSSPSPDAARIVLVRHGQGVVNVSGVIGGLTGCVGLTDLGRVQVAALADRIRRNFFHSGSVFNGPTNPPRLSAQLR